MMEKLFKIVLSRPWTVIIITAVITVYLALGIPKLKFDNTIEVFMPKSDPHYLDYQKIKDVYGNVGKFVIIDVTGKEVFTTDFFNELNNFITDLEEYQSFDKVKEENRINKLDKLLAGYATYDSLLNSFNEDLPFKREIQRHINGDISLSGILNYNDINSIKSGTARAFNLKKSEKINDILSPITAQDISGKNNTLITIDIIEKDSNNKRIIPSSEDEFKRFKTRLTRNPAYKGSLYVIDKNTGKITDLGIYVKLSNVKDIEDIADKIWDISSGYNKNNLIKITTQGIPIVNRFMNEYMKRDLIIFLPLVLLVVILVFFQNFRTLKGVLIPALSLSASVIWIMGLMGHLGFKITAIGVSLPALMTAVGSSYSIHVLNRYYIDYNLISKIGKTSGLRIAMSHIAVTVFLAGFTTFLGFASLLTNQITAIKEWGFFSALGVIFAVWISITLIPAVLFILPHKTDLDKKGSKVQQYFNPLNRSWIDGLLERIIRLSTHHNRVVISIVMVVIIFSLIGIYKIKVDTSIMSYFKEDDYIRVSSKMLSEKFGGYLGFSILVDSGTTDGVKRAEYLKIIEEIKQWLASEENYNQCVGRADAITDVVKTMHMAMNNDEMSYYKIPDDDQTIIDYFELYSGEDNNSDGRLDEFESFFDPDYRTAMIFVMLGERKDHLLSAEEMGHIMDRIDKYLAIKLKDKYEYKIAGEPVIMLNLSRYIVYGQLWSLLFSLISVALVVILLFKNWTAGLISLIPLSVAVMLNFGIMGWFDIYLDDATAIIASITIGIGVDNTIHFLNTFRHYKEPGLSVDDIISKTLSIAGRAMIYTSVALVFGFIVLGLSNFKPILLFGLLTAVSMVATTTGALVILPLVIKMTQVNLEENESDSIFWRLFYIGKYFEYGEAEGEAE